MSVELGARRASAILLDIEGTTTPIAFVVEVLFPVRARAPATAISSSMRARPGPRTLSSSICTASTPGIATAGQRRATVGRQDPRRAPGIGRGYVEWLMDRDRKSTR